MKRVISILVCLVMLLGMVPARELFPIEVSAESDTYTVVQKKAATLAASDTGTKGAWYINGSVFSTETDKANYIEIAEAGFTDPGSLHVYQDNVTNNDMSVGLFLGGQAAGTYTVKLSVKGDIGYQNQTCKFYPYGTDGQVSNLSAILQTTVVEDWTEVTYEVEVAKEFFYLIFSFSKYNWATDMYVDNIQLLNSSGTDILAGVGSFFSLEEVTCSSAVTGQYPLALDTTKIAESYQAYTGVWTPFCHYTAAQGSWQGTWPAWDTAAGNYAEIVADGYQDAGSLHMKSAGSRNAGVAIDAGMVSGESYTLGMWVKGTASSNKMLSLYGNGDGTIIGNPQYCGEVASQTVPANWTYLEKTFTANRSNLILVANDWGVTDIYIDNLTLTDENGTDLLSDYGGFCYSVEGLLTLNTESPASAYNAPNGQWSVMYPAGSPNDTTWTAWDDTHYGQIVAQGNQDKGALRLVSAPSKNAGVAIGVDMIKGESYTLGLWAKGTSNSGKVLFSYANGDPTIIGASGELTADWSYYEITLTCGTTQLNIVAADWGNTDIYVDNITLKDSNGVDLLAGLGNFCVKEEADGPEDPAITGSKLYQSSVLFSGDSISYGSDQRAWASRIGEKYSMDFVNASVSGASVSTCRGSNRMLAQLEAYQNQTFDYVILHGGVNDAWDEAPVGAVTDSFQTADFDTATFAGGLEELFYYCRQYFEDARVGFIINFQFHSDIVYGKLGDMSEYVAVTKTICDKWQIPYLDLYNNAELTAALKVDTTEYLADGVHPNAAGYEIITPYIADWMNQVVAEQIVLREPTEEGWISWRDYETLELGTDYDYSFAVLGDIQHITDYTPGDLHYLFDYILDSKDSKNIQFVFGMGDSTNDIHNEANNLVEWQLVQEQFFRLNGVLPYTVIRGNHDKVVRMNAYLADPEATGYTDQLDGFYQEGSVVNAWKEFSAGGIDYLNIVIDYESSDSVLEWAADVIESHPNHRVIVGTHVYLNEDGTYDNEMNPGGADPGIVNNAQQVWDKLISQHENIFMVMCGHTSTDDVLVQHKTGVHGNRITEIRVNSQYTDLVYMNKDGDHRSGPENGVGMVTMLYFKNDGTQVAVEHYSALRGWYRELQSFETEQYPHYGWRYNETPEDSGNVDIYIPDTGVADAPAILQSGLGNDTVDELVTENALAYSGTGVSILPDHNMNLGTHTYALHSGTRAVEPSQTYTISYQIKGLSQAGKTWLQIHFCRSALGGSDTWESQWQPGGVIAGPVDDWQTVSYDVTMDGETSAIEVYLIVNGSEMYVDNFSIVKKGDTQNIVTNGDFELGTDGAYPTGFYTMKTGGIGTVEKVSGAGVDGSAAVRIEPRPGYILKTEQAIAVEANREYTLSYMARIPGKSTELTPVIRLYDSQGGMTVLTGTEAKQSGTCDWQNVRYTFTTAGDTAAIQVCLLAYGGQVDVDGISLTDADGTNWIVNGDFRNQLEGFAGEFVQGLQEGTVKCVTSARPHSLIVSARLENGVLNAYDGENLIGTVDWLYGELEHKLNYGLYISDGDTAKAVAEWVTARMTENLWVIAGEGMLLDTVLAVNGNIRGVLDCTADSAAAESCGYAYVLVDASADITELKKNGTGVIVSADTVTQALLTDGADAVLTGDALSAILSLEQISGAEDAAEIQKWNLSLAEDIGVNFYLRLEEAQAANAVVNITAGGISKVIPVSELTEEDGLYRVCVNVAAAQMTEQINLRVVINGILAENKTYTVRQYADYILDGDYDEATKTLVKEMLNYGSAAQSYFGYHTQVLAGAGIAGAGTADVPERAETEMGCTGAVEGVRYYGAALLFQSKTTVRFYFTGELAGCTAEVSGKTLPLVQKDGMYYVEVADITPDALEEAVTVTVTRDGQALAVSYSPMNYMVRMYEKGSDTLQALLKAMYNYHLAAKSFVAAQIV